MANTAIRDLGAGTLAADSAFPIQNTSAATVAEKASYSKMGGLVHAANTITTANLTASVGTLHKVTIAGLTANRDFILPDTAAIGERVGVYVVDGDATYVLQIKTAATASEINGADASSTLWSSVFIQNEIVIFECIKAGGAGDTDWIVIQDGRIACNASMADTTGTANYYTNDTVITPAYNVASPNVGGTADTTADQIVIRRAGIYRISMSAVTPSVLDSGEIMQQLLTVNGTTKIRTAIQSAVTNALVGANCVRTMTLAVGDVLLGKIYHNEGANLTWSTDEAYAPRLEITEIF